MMVAGTLIDIDDLPARFRGPLTAEALMDDQFFSLEEVHRRHVIQVLEGVAGKQSASCRNPGYQPRNYLPTSVQDEA